MSNEKIIETLRGRTVLQLIPSLELGGAEQTVLDISAALNEVGANALVVSEGGRLEQELKKSGAELIKAPIASRNPLKMRQSANWLKKLIKNRAIAIVHARSRAPAWVAWWALGGKHGGPRPSFVTTYHGAYSGKTALKRRYNSIMARGDRVIANSEWTAQEIRRQYGLTAPCLTTIPRGSDPNRFDPEQISAEIMTAFRQNWAGNSGSDREADLAFLLLPGRFRSWKGQRLALEALAALPTEMQCHTRLVLAGETDSERSYSQTLRQDINRLGLTEQVKLVGPPDDFPAALHAADIVLSPSLRPEAFGRIAVEAGLMERPMIVADHGGARETVQHDRTGLRVRPGDSEALSAAIGTMLAMPVADRQAMGRAARVYCQQHFTLDALKARTLTVYSDLLNSQE